LHSALAHITCVFSHLLSGEPSRLRREGRRRLVFDADDCRRERPGATVREEQSRLPLE
jgi:hypothetical protein